MTEFALVVPVLMVLIMGGLDGALLMFSLGTARYGSAEVASRGHPGQRR